MKYTPQKDYKVFVNKLQKVVPIHKRGGKVWLGFVYNSNKKKRVQNIKNFYFTNIVL
jgi:hypothetical protein